MIDTETFEEWLNKNSICDMDSYALMGYTNSENAWNHQAQKIAERDARIAELEKLGIDNGIKLRVRIQQLQSKLSLTVEQIRKIGGMAGNPDAVEACRVICKTARETLKQIGEV